jgi:hypothetical protein
MELYCANKILQAGYSVIGVQVAGALRPVIPRGVIIRLIPLSPSPGGEGVRTRETAP